LTTAIASYQLSIKASRGVLVVRRCENEYSYNCSCRVPVACPYFWHLPCHSVHVYCRWPGDTKSFYPTGRSSIGISGFGSYSHRHRCRVEMGARRRNHFPLRMVAIRCANHHLAKRSHIIRYRPHVTGSTLRDQRTPEMVP